MHGRDEEQWKNVSRKAKGTAHTLRERRDIPRDDDDDGDRQPARLCEIFAMIR